MSEEKQLRGFALLSPERRREIASKGGQAAQATGKCHRYNSSEAVAAGQKGGVSVSNDREHMKKIGKMGGLSRARKYEIIG